MGERRGARGGAVPAWRGSCGCTVAVLRLHASKAGGKVVAALLSVWIGD